MTRVGDARLGGGESLVWDERRERLYFVDCQASTLHWLDDDDATLQTYRLLETHRDRAHRRGPVRRRARRRPARHRPRRRHDRIVASDPPELGGRCNDACADLAGNIITGKLNLGPTEGSAWWWSHQHGWQIIDPDIANTNGPAVGVIDGLMNLIIGDPSAVYFSYPYDPTTGTVGVRSVFGDTSGLEGMPDGATLDVDGGPVVRARRRRPVGP